MRNEQPVKRRVGRPRKEERREGDPSSREQILAAAAVAFAERGFEGASLDLIAERSGFSMGAIYHHFSGKPEMLMEVVEHALRAHDLPGSAHDNPANILDLLNFPRVYLDPANKMFRQLLGEILAAANRHADVAKRLAAFTEGVTADIVRSIDQAKAQGSIPATLDADKTARMFLVNCAGLIHTETFYPEMLGNTAWTNFVLDSLRSLLGLAPASRGRRAARA